MYLQEEFSRLIWLYQQASEGKMGTVEEIYSKSLEFIQHLKEQILKGNEEDRAAALKMMDELYKLMKTNTKALCEKAGVTEEQLLSKSEDPANYTPEQWRLMQESKEKLSEAGKELADTLQGVQGTKSEETPPSPGSVMSEGPSQKTEPKKKKAKKSQWLKS